MVKKMDNKMPGDGNNTHRGPRYTADVGFISSMMCAYDVSHSLLRHGL